MSQRRRIMLYPETAAWEPHDGRYPRRALRQRLKPRSPRLLEHHRAPLVE